MSATRTLNDEHEGHHGNRIAKLTCRLKHCRF